MQKLTKEDIRAIAIVDVDQTLLTPQDVAEDIPNIETQQSELWMGESWLLLTAALGANIDEHMNIFGEFRNQVNGDKQTDQLNHDQMAQKLIELWENALGEPITKDRLEAICIWISHTVSEQALAAMEKLIANGILVVIGTGGFEKSAKSIADLINLQDQLSKEIDTAGLKFWFGNTEFIFDEDDILINFSHKKNVIGYKVQQAEKTIAQIIEQLDLNPNIPKLAIGDGKSDLGLFINYLGFAFKPNNNDVKMEAVSVSDNWPSLVSNIIFFLDQLLDEEILLVN